MEPALSATARRAAVVLAILAVQAACTPVQSGRSGVNAELDRLKARDGFAVVASAPTRTVFAAKGREVVIAPASGFCVASDSLDISGAAAFALLSDCAAGSNIRATPRTFPGIFTISVSGGPMVDPGTSPAAALDGLETFVASKAGLTLLGRGPSSSQVSVVETRRVGDGLYVLVEDRTGSPLPVLAPRFWRAFVELSGRMSMVTASTFREAPVAEDDLLAFLVRQVVALRQANNASPSGDELQLADRVDDRYLVAAADPSDGEVEFEVVGTGDGLPDFDETPATGQAVATLPDDPYQLAAAPAADADPAGRSGTDPAAEPAYRGPSADPAYRGPTTARPADPAPAPAAAATPAPTGYRPSAGPDATPAPAASTAQPGTRVTSDAPYAGPTSAKPYPAYQGPTAGG